MRWMVRTEVVISLEISLFAILCRSHVFSLVIFMGMDIS